MPKEEMTQSIDETKGRTLCEQRQTGAETTACKRAHVDSEDWAWRL